MLIRDDLMIGNRDDDWVYDDHDHDDDKNDDVSLCEYSNILYIMILNKYKT